VHLLHEELFDDVSVHGYQVAPGEMGENVTTRGVLLLSLPVGTVLRLGAEAAVELTGLRNPCVQIDTFAPGLMKQVLGRDPNGDVVRKAGVMAVVRSGGVVRPGDPITVHLPDGAHRRLEPV
jgi:MOSC domain-containing protein YiiM